MTTQPSKCDALSFRAKRPKVPTWSEGICFFLVFAAVIATATSAQTKRPKIFGISHARIRVSNYCKALAFYEQVLGEHPSCPGANRAEPIGGDLALWSGQWITLNVNSFYQAPSNPDNLLEVVGLYTENAAGLHSYLESRGIKVKEEPGGGHPTLWLQDPEGHFIEFFEDRPRPTEELPQWPEQNLRRIVHAGFIVRDRAAMEHFYKDILGFRPYWHGGMKDDQTDWVSLQVPDGTDWVEFMVNVPENADQRLRGIMNHIALGVPDIQAAREQLVKNGVHLTEEPKLGRDGKWQLNVYDPDQTRIEFMEFTPKEKPCCSEFTGPHPKP